MSAFLGVKWSQVSPVAPSRAAANGQPLRDRAGLPVPTGSAKSPMGVSLSLLEVASPRCETPEGVVADRRRLLTCWSATAGRRCQGPYGGSPASWLSCVSLVPVQGRSPAAIQMRSRISRTVATADEPQSAVLEGVLGQSLARSNLPSCCTARCPAMTC